MDDLSVLLDAAQTTTCEFLGTTINLEVYTAGASRLTHEETRSWREVAERFAPASARAVELEKKIKDCQSLVEANPDDGEQKARLQKLQAEWDGLDTGPVEQMRVVLPLMLKEWSLNGAPMKRNGKDFPPTAENLMTVPDGLLLAVGTAAMAVWCNPTTPGLASGSGQTETSENNQTETTLP